MTKYKYIGEFLRTQSKSLVIEFMTENPNCGSDSSGLKQAEIFRECGLDWGEKEKATSSHQQYWLVALLRELQDEGLIEQIKDRGSWRIKRKNI